MRLAIGAPRRRLVLQLIVESVLLAVIGTLLGILVARGLSTLLVAQIAAGFGSLFIDLTWNMQMFVFTTGVSALACLLLAWCRRSRRRRWRRRTLAQSRQPRLTMSRERFGLRGCWWSRRWRCRWCC